MSLEDEEKFTDIASHGDTLVVLSRSFVYTSLPPYKTLSAFNFMRQRIMTAK